MKREAEIALVTGVADRILARRLLEQWLARGSSREARVLAEQRDEGAWSTLLGELPREQQTRVRVLDGRAHAMDLGLTGKEIVALAGEVTHVIHAGTTSRPGASEEDARLANEDATREVIELAKDARRLSRLVLVSSATVSGTRSGYVLEDELDAQHPARNDAERSLRRAEAFVKRARLPHVVIRPGILFGDSRTGESDPDDALHELVRFMLGEPPEMRLPIPVRSDIPVHLLPVDFAAAACVQILDDERALGRTLHLVDPDPLNAGRVLELLARAVGRRFPRSILPASLTSLLLKAPVGRVVPWPTAFLDQLSTEVVYDDHNTRALLAGSGLECPALESYVRVVVRAARDRYEGRVRSA